MKKTVFWFIVALVSVALAPFISTSLVAVDTNATLNTSLNETNSTTNASLYYIRDDTDIASIFPNLSSIIMKNYTINYSQGIRVFKNDTLRHVNLNFRANNLTTSPLLRYDNTHALMIEMTENRNPDERTELLPRETGSPKFEHYNPRRSRFYSLIKQNYEFMLYRTQEMARYQVLQEQNKHYNSYASNNAKDAGGYYGSAERSGRLTNANSSLN